MPTQTICQSTHTLNSYAILTSHFVYLFIFLYFSALKWILHLSRYKSCPNYLFVDCLNSVWQPHTHERETFRVRVEKCFQLVPLMHCNSPWRWSNTSKQEKNENCRDKVGGILSKLRSEDISGNCVFNGMQFLWMVIPNWMFFQRGVRWPTFRRMSLWKLFPRVLSGLISPLSSSLDSASFSLAR